VRKAPIHQAIHPSSPHQAHQTTESKTPKPGKILILNFQYRHFDWPAHLICQTITFYLTVRNGTSSHLLWWCIFPQPLESMPRSHIPSTTFRWLRITTAAFTIQRSRFSALRAWTWHLRLREFSRGNNSFSASEGKETGQAPPSDRVQSMS